MYFFYEHKRLIILLIILGVLLLGCGAYGFIFWNGMQEDTRNAQKRAEVSLYMFDECNWQYTPGNNLIHVEELGYYAGNYDDYVNPDSDFDCYPDIYEEMVGTNPNEYDSFGEYYATYEPTCSGARLHLEGTPYIATIRVEVNNYNTNRSAAFGSRVISVSKPAMEDCVYKGELFLDVSVPEGCKLSQAKINKISPSGELTPVKTAVHEEDGTVSCEIDEFTSYVAVFDSLIGSDKKSKPVLALMIDDSASMFYYNGEDDCNNDPEMLRYDFCQGLIDAIGKDVLIQMDYFTGDVFEGFDFNTSASDMKKTISKLKSLPEDERVFTGTALGTALQSSISTVKTMSNPNKFIVFLTDGVSSEGYDLWDKSVAECSKSGITLIVIGLGDEVDAEKMAKDAANTGGYFLNAKTAECIETVAGSIEAVIANNGIQVLSFENMYDEKFTKEAYLVADSGFSASRHGLKSALSDLYLTASGKNLIIKDQTYGVAEIARQMYMGIMPEDAKSAKIRSSHYVALNANDYDKLSEEELANISVPVLGYDLMDTKAYTEYTSLHDIDIPVLSALSKYNETLENAVSNGISVYVENNVLKLEDASMPSAIKNNPDLYYAEIIKLQEPQEFVLLDKSATLKFDSYVTYHPNLNALLSRGVKTPSDNYFLQVLYAYTSRKQSLEYTEARFNTGTMKDNAELLDTLATRLQSGDPVVLAMDIDCYNIAKETNFNMNAVALYRDCTDVNIYYLKCYNAEQPDTPYFYSIDISAPENYVITDLWQDDETKVLGIVA